MATQTVDITRIALEQTYPPAAGSMTPERYVNALLTIVGRVDCAYLEECCLDWDYKKSRFATISNPSISGAWRLWNDSSAPDCSIELILCLRYGNAHVEALEREIIRCIEGKSHPVVVHERSGILLSNLRKRSKLTRTFLPLTWSTLDFHFSPEPGHKYGDRYTAECAMVALKAVAIPIWYPGMICADAADFLWAVESGDFTVLTFDAYNTEELCKQMVQAFLAKPGLSAAFLALHAPSDAMVRNIAAVLDAVHRFTVKEANFVAGAIFDAERTRYLAYVVVRDRAAGEQACASEQAIK